MRVPAAVSLESRDGTLTKDAKMVNAIAEAHGEGDAAQLVMRKRSGLAKQVTLPTSGGAQLLFHSNGIRAVAADKIVYLSSPYLGMDGTKKGANVTLSNPARTVSCSNVGSVFSNGTTDKGQFTYAEVTITSAGGGQRIGYGTYSAGFEALAPGNDLGPFVIAYDVSDGKIYQNNAVVTSTGVTATNGDVIGILVYDVSGVGTSVKWMKNGTLITTGTTGLSDALACRLVLGSTAAGGSMSFNFGEAPFSYTPPSNIEASLSPTEAGLPMWMKHTGESAATRRLLFHNTKQAWRRQTYLSNVASTATGPAGGGPYVPGIGYLDGYFFLMDAAGKINNSANEDPSSWGALDYIYAASEPGSGKFIGSSLNYVVALKEYSTEFFYDAANATGSVLSAVPGGVTRVGCASGYSVGLVQEYIAWISQSKDGRRGVHLLRGLDIRKVSTPEIDRILAADSLGTVNAYGTTISGHNLYILTLVDSAVTLVYDLEEGVWSQWTSLTAGSPVSVSSITRSGDIATVVATSHGFSDGAPVLMAGATPSDYNGIKQITYVDANTFTFDVTGSPTTPATGTITATGYTESYFRFSHYVDANGVQLLFGTSDGKLYKPSETLYQDDGVPINCFARTPRIDVGDKKTKTMPSIALIGDKVSSKVAIRYSDDDSATFTTYRRADMTDVARPEIRRCGGFQKRSIELRHVENTALKIDALDIDVRA